jgi:dolichol-phosphate mannosyltransferase
MGDQRVLVVMPTYNEKQSLEATVSSVCTSNPEVHVLIVDDASPDGTGELADALARERLNIAVLHRSAKEGLGPAYVAGFHWGLERGFEVLVEMDADGSHRATDLASILDRLRDADVVIGSRWVPGGGTSNWSAGRRMLSRGGNAYVRIMLGIQVRDSTSGFRAYRADALRRLLVTEVSSSGYCFQVDMTRRAIADRVRIEEVPITFVEREHGISKMNGGIVVEAVLRVALWALEDLRKRWIRWGSSPTRGTSHE